MLNTPYVSAEEAGLTWLREVGGSIFSQSEMSSQDALIDSQTLQLGTRHRSVSLIEVRIRPITVAEVSVFVQSQAAERRGAGAAEAAFGRSACVCSVNVAAAGRGALFISLLEVISD